ncbi:ornithine decarboxylase [Liquorilactobacillus sucicola DSM 21376 = JCM 15457]|uniref:Ornithine decarboxylase n=1 Tax=Liquorilactobacillus sucicola DSM 21376 = JCM 15457 TaxID=1423806 RepID=A0A0R2DRC8_9LACO|nr:putative ornithine decarboxylase [Liquorilactobacillus sucicola]KRN06592.1 ornithine decarboxylase [Liquorilactobacillus sucicola DSM 21376 = JCM 15457]
MKILKIALPQALFTYLPQDWTSVVLNSTLQGAELAAIVIREKERTDRELAAKLLVDSGLDIPVVTVAEGDEATVVRKKIKEKAQAYITKNVPPFLTDLIAFANDRPVSFTTPGHHNGQYYEKHPAGVVFNRFFGENMLYADTSDTVAELGDTMTHAGTPLAAEKRAAAVYNADKAYFCTNGTTSANTICASAVLTPDDLVLFDRNNHKSLYNSALVMNGAKPVYIPTDRNALGLIGEMDPEAFEEKKLRKEVAKVSPEKAHAARPFRLAIVQLETYDGVFYNAKWILDKIGRLCDYVLFDCAWGGYEQFIPLMRELSPLSYTYQKDDPGILVTQSVHKQQAGLGQTSQILKKDKHISGQKRYVDHKHFNNAYLKYVTSSYSYPLYASLTVNAYLASGDGKMRWWQKLLERSIDWRKKLLQNSKLFRPLVPPKFGETLWQDIATNDLATELKYWRLTPEDKWHGFNKVAAHQVMLDPFKLTIVTPGVDLKNGKYTSNGIPGPIVAEFLTERRIIRGKADLNSLLFLLTPGDTDADLQALLDALLDFESYYDADAPLSQVLPRLYQQYKKRYYGYTIKQLCQEMHLYYKKRQTFGLQQKLFEKKGLQSYECTPQEADLAFRRNQGELCSLDDIVGKVALEGALPYPPGIFIVAPGERWRGIDRAYFKVLIGAIERFAGFVPEIQGVYYQENTAHKLKVAGEVLASQNK